jgi:hypothetical protein
MLPGPEGNLTGSLVRQNIRGFFKGNYKNIFRVWVSLLKETTLSHNTTSSDKYVAHAFKAINNVFENQNTPPLFLRLAYIQFNDMIKTVQFIASNHRHHGQIVLAASFVSSGF